MKAEPIHLASGLITHHTLMPEHLQIQLPCKQAVLKSNIGELCRKALTEMPAALMPESSL